MSLHSHWATIKRQKGANDAKRGQLFTKLVREITIAAKEGGVSADGNPRLRLAIQKAKDNGMPNDNIDRALKKVAGGEGGSSIEEIWYEGYGPGGAAILVMAYTDNRNRTANDVRATFNHSGGNIGEVGSVNWIFDRKGLLIVEGATGDLEAVALTAIDAGADDFNIDPDSQSMEVYTDAMKLEAVRETLTSQGAQVVNAEIAMLPKTRVDLDPATARQNLRLLERLDDLDDVQQVYTNANFPTEVLQKAG
jgi:YebC/PmpR family DNA-binding regulatory protein